MKKSEMNSLERRKIGRTPRIYHLSVLFMLLGLLFSSNISFGQAKRISITCNNTPLSEVFKELEKLSHHKFVFNYEDVKTFKVSMAIKEKTIEEVLDMVLSGMPFSYKIDGDYVTIGRKIQTPIGIKRITGFVKDESHNPLPGVTVQVKELKIGVATDKDGRYMMGVPSDMNKFTLVFSFMGMETKEITYVGKDTINVVLRDDTKDIEEVVVTGYQVVKEKGMAGSVVKVKGDDLIQTPTTSLEQMLQGVVPGMIVMNQDGLTGTRQKVRVRGTSTLLGNAEPVWVVDGIIQEDNLPFDIKEFSAMSSGGNSSDVSNNIDMMRDFIGSSISWLNPADIEDITVLKDASATAIYGVKAANGVIVIRTKKGERGQLSIGYSGHFSTSVRMNYNKLELMNSKDRVALSREAYERGAEVLNEQIGYTGLLLAYQRGEITLDQFNTQAKEMEVRNTDWFDILYRTPFSQSHSLNFSGGDGRSTYRASFSYNNQNNTARGNDRTGYAANVNISSIFWKKLTMNSMLSVSKTETNSFARDVTPFEFAQRTSRVIPCFDKNGDYKYVINDGYKYNILNEMDNSGNKNEMTNINLTLSLRWVLSECFTFDVTIGGGISNSLAETWYTERSRKISQLRGYEFGQYTALDKEYQNSSLPFGGELTTQESRNFNYTERNQLTFVKNIGLHNINAMAGVEVRSNQTRAFSQINYGYQPDRGKVFATPPMKLPNGTVNSKYASTTPSISDSKNNYFSYYMALGYMYDSRYSINISLRGDASNRFGQDTRHRLQPVWSLGLRWNLTDEAWMKNQSIISDMSITASLGYQGNVVEGVSPNLIAKMKAVDLLTGEYGMTITKRPTPDLKWEKTLSTNIGVNYGFFKNKINGTFNYYYKKTTDLISNREVPLENGVTTMHMNGGDMTNQGWDLSVTVVPIRTKNFMWSISSSFSSNNNKVRTALAELNDWKELTKGTVFKEGYPVGSFWAFRFKGLDPNNGGPLLDMTGIETNEAKNDYTKFMAYMGTIEPEKTVGLSMVFRWKRLSIPFSVYLNRGTKTFLPSPYKDAHKMPSEMTNASTQLLKRWRKPGDEKHTVIPSIPVRENCVNIPFVTNTIAPYDAWAFSDIRVVDTWFLRFNNFSFNYNLPDRWIAGFAQRVNVSFTASNPIQFKSKDFKGRDPEVALGKQPRSQDFSWGVSVTF